MIETIETGSELIAKFMGWTTNSKKSVYTYPLDDNSMFVGYKILTLNLRYCSSWDWLVPVVHKCIFGTNLNSTNSDEWEHLIKNIQSALSNCEITNLFDTVVEFINWYNKNK